MIGIFIWAVYGLFDQGPLPQFKLACIAMPVMLFSMFIGLHYPTTVHLSKSYIIFESFGKKNKYVWKDIQNFRVKCYPFGSTLIDIGEQKVLGGRYWIKSHMEGYDELLHFLQEKANLMKKNKQ